MQKVTGAIVADVMANSPAAAAGLRVGDVILQVGGKVPSDERALLRAVATAPVGEKLTFGLWRDGKEQPLDIAVKEWPRQMWDALDAPEEAANAHHHVAADLGLRLAVLDDATRNQYGVTEAKTGAVVTGVAPGSDAALHGLVPGDVILRVQETPVATPADAQAALDAARAQKRPFIVALIQPKVHDKPGPAWIALRASDD
jgi:serine protease Do